MFDWYMPPADKFQYETDFQKYTNTEYVSLQQLDPLFQNSRISTAEFLQIWQLIDIKFEQRLSKVQFVHFMHVLVSKRRGWDVPISLPLTIKEEFLRFTPKEARQSVYVRPHENVNDVGKSFGKSIPELEDELRLLQEKVDFSSKDQETLSNRLHDLLQSESELSGLRDYYSRVVTAHQATTVTTDQFEQMVKVLQADYMRLLEFSQ
jgi:hypothetical protein